MGRTRYVPVEYEDGSRGMVVDDTPWETFHTHITELAPGLYGSKVWNSCVHKVLWKWQPGGEPAEIMVGDYFKKIETPTPDQIEFAKLLISCSMKEFEVVNDEGVETKKNIFGEEASSTYHVVKEGVDYPLQTLMRLAMHVH